MHRDHRGGALNTESHELIDHGDAPFLLTCEHASQRLPEGWSWPEDDHRLVGTHWAYDIGAADLTRELAAALGCRAVLSRFTRLLVDPNRHLQATTLFRAFADGEPVLLNTDLSEPDRDRRIDRYYRPYHEAIHGCLAERQGLVFAVHSFTPVYEGQARTLEVGVLFDADEAPARRLAETIAAAGYLTELNEPWSGKDGLMFSPQHHAERHGLPALEIEVRQDLCGDAAWRARFVPVLAEGLRRL